MVDPLIDLLIGLLLICLIISIASDLFDSQGLIPDVSVIPTPNEDPLGLGLDYGEMEEGEIDEEVDTQMEEESDVKGI